MDIFAPILHALQHFHLTAWKLVGFAGTFMFTSRWFVQLYYTRKYKRVVMPLSFWWLPVSGSALLLAYSTVEIGRASCRERASIVGRPVPAQSHVPVARR